MNNLQMSTTLYLPAVTIGICACQIKGTVLRAVELPDLAIKLGRLGELESDWQELCLDADMKVAFMKPNIAEYEGSSVRLKFTLEYTVGSSQTPGGLPEGVYIDDVPIHRENCTEQSPRISANTREFAYGGKVCMK